MIGLCLLVLMLDFERERKERRETFYTNYLNFVISKSKCKGGEPFTLFYFFPFLSLFYCGAQS